MKYMSKKCVQNDPKKMSEVEMVEWAKRFTELKPCLCNRCFQDDSKLIDLETLIDFKQGLNELLSGEYELYVLTLLHQAIQKTQNVNSSKPRNYPQRMRRKVSYHIAPFGNVCRSVFKELLGIGDKKLRNLFKHLDEHDVPIPRKHGNTGISPQNKLSSGKIDQIEAWINDLAKRIGEPSRRNINQKDKKTIIFLPACYTITMLFELCVNSISQKSDVVFSRSTFYSILNSDVCKHIRVNSPKTDVCETCDSLRTELNSIAHASPYQEGQEIPLPSASLSNHLFLARTARDEYKNDQKRARDGAISHFSFDYSQNLVLPQKSNQPGPFYFYSLKNCYLFGITDESCNYQMNYLIDEAECAKGSNEVVSMLWHFLLSLPEKKKKHMIFNADNCIGQNKNNTIMKFFAWLCSTGYSQIIEIKFMIKGHTFFSPDSNFSHIKRKYRRSDAFSLDHLAKIARGSSKTNDAEVLDGNCFFEYTKTLGKLFKDIPNITNYHHFYFDASCPGIIRLKEKENANSAWTEKNILKAKTSDVKAYAKKLNFPSSIPPGLPAIKQLDLYEKVRKYVPKKYKDTLCPKPSKDVILYGKKQKKEKSQNRRKKYHKIA